MRKTDREAFLLAVLGNEQIPANQARALIEEKLRNAILDGSLPSGTALRQQELASLFGVSRMPVREALRQLEAQSLLRVETNKGAVVAPLIGEDAVDAYALRILLESEALRLSVPLLDADDLATARRCIEMMEVETDYTHFGTLNRMFHMALYAKASNQRLMRLVEQGLNEEERFLRFNLEKMNLGKLAQDDHWQLLHLAEEKDVERTVEVLQVHLNRGVKAITRYLNSLAEKEAKPVGGPKKSPA
ncbi:GntR family transcriptional regulator [Pseudomonas sp. v388]|uniref:GntR family transcriptional regulator n=1 Tax=Pseudomonas sp. v388 TaxID=2479849 RepID=UPI000F78600C|nr:GntR family transcriptional regulator [Pseudomonas sp. v388]RRV03870.1 GntR family transcriptional regulator [Pseudomonas sp. v388]